MKTELKTSSRRMDIGKWMPSRRSTIGAAILMAQVALTVDPAFAASSGHGDAHGSIADLKWPFVNFTLYAIGMYMLLRGIVSKGWEARATRIAAEASKGQRELEAAQVILAAAKENQKKLPVEQAAIAKTLAAEGQAEAAKVLQDAQERAKEIEKQAASRIVAEQQASVQSTRRRIAEKVIGAAESKIRSGISAESDKRIRQNTATSLSGLKAV